MNAEELDFIFGSKSKGVSLLERAKSSDNEYVRSQVQIALASEKAKGRRFSALEALNNYGIDILQKIAEEKSAILSSEYNEPANTLETRRNALNLSREQVARKANISIKQVEMAETPGKISPIRELEQLAQILALDERTLGFVPGAKGDAGLGVRLREMTQGAGDVVKFSANDVLALTEGAWVIARQDYLEIKNTHNRKFQPSYNYNYPSYERGYELAKKTREMLEFDGTQPVESLKILLEEELAIPVVQQALNSRFAGATIANGNCRGIIVNEQGANANVWVRRMTLAHELGHLLWDPDTRLNKLTVDEYQGLENAYHDSKVDAVEIRANAFAVAFLAPPEGIKDLVAQHDDGVECINAVTSKYGISTTAAKYHVKNITGVDLFNLHSSFLERPGDDWIARENLSVDYFPIKSTPISRRGRFAWLAAEKFKERDISADTAAMLLCCSKEDFLNKYQTVLELGQS